MTTPVIRVDAVRKTYGRTVAVDEVSFDVQPGEIFGLIGPNGAGKTTTMECVEGLRAPDRGTISVLGLDPGKDRYQLQRADWRAAPGGAAPEADQGARGSRLLGLLVSVIGRRRPPARAAWPQRQAECVVHDALGRPEAAPLHRPRAHQRSRARVPRRVDDRTRSAGAPRHLGPGARHPRPRQDRVPDHAPDGGGRTAVRPGGDPRSRPCRRHRHTQPSSSAGTAPNERSSSRPRTRARAERFRAIPAVGSVDGDGPRVHRSRARRRSGDAGDSVPRRSTG